MDEKVSSNKKTNPTPKIRKKKKKKAQLEKEQVEMLESKASINK